MFSIFKKKKPENPYRIVSLHMVDGSVLYRVQQRIDTVDYGDKWVSIYSFKDKEEAEDEYKCLVESWRANTVLETRPYEVDL